MLKQGLEKEDEQLLTQLAAFALFKNIFRRPPGFFYRVDAKSLYLERRL
jgi:hypothetical protein